MKTKYKTQTQLLKIGEKHVNRSHNIIIEPFPYNKKENAYITLEFKGNKPKIVIMCKNNFISAIFTKKIKYVRIPF